tara:strand:- start:30 stop:644 length:615 start_codon:yes stop_codon:yes gene_type:complete
MSKTTDKVIDLMEKEQATPNNKCLPKENIYKSLAAFQQECQVIHKGTKGYGYSYADLPSILSVINPLLKKHKLGFTQLLDGTELRTILFHVSSGDTIESCVAIPQGVQLKGMNEFQVYGSAITYFRRYAISSLLGIVTDKDTDAGGEQVNSKKNYSNIKFEKGSLSDTQFARAVETIKEGKYSKEQLLKTFELSNKQSQALTLI